jgi:hypothetical protein
MYQSVEVASARCAVFFHRRPRSHPDCVFIVRRSSRFSVDPASLCQHPSSVVQSLPSSAQCACVIFCSDRRASSSFPDARFVSESCTRIGDSFALDSSRRNRDPPATDQRCSSNKFDVRLVDSVPPFLLHLVGARPRRPPTSEAVRPASHLSRTSSRIVTAAPCAPAPPIAAPAPFPQSAPVPPQLLLRIPRCVPAHIPFWSPERIIISPEPNRRAFYAALSARTVRRFPWIFSFPVLRQCSTRFASESDPSFSTALSVSRPSQPRSPVQCVCSRV